MAIASEIKGVIDPERGEAESNGVAGQTISDVLRIGEGFGMILQRE